MHFSSRSCRDKNVQRILHEIVGAAEAHALEQPHTKHVSGHANRLHNSRFFVRGGPKITFGRYISRKNFYVLNCLPSSSVLNADSIISSDLGAMFGEFFNVVAIFLTNSTVLLALSFVVLPKSQFARCGVLAQICLSIVCLPLTKLCVGPVSAAVAAWKESDGSFNFQVFATCCALRSP